MNTSTTTTTIRPNSTTTSTNSSTTPKYLEDDILVNSEQYDNGNRSNYTFIRNSNPNDRDKGIIVALEFMFLAMLIIIAIVLLIFCIQEALTRRRERCHHFGRNLRRINGINTQCCTSIGSGGVSGVGLGAGMRQGQLRVSSVRTGGCCGGGFPIRTPMYQPIGISSFPGGGGSGYQSRAYRSMYSERARVSSPMENC